MADSLVFDFPDPTPHFDFDNLSNGGGSAGGLSHNSGGSKGAPAAATNASNKKTSSKKSRALFKSRFMNKGNSSNSSGSSTPNTRSSHQQWPASPVNGYDSPLNKSMGDHSGTTDTTASLSLGSGSFSPNRLQYGQSSKQHNNNDMMIGRTGSTSPKTSPAAVAPPPPNNNTTGKESPRFEFSMFDDTSPSPKNHSGMRKTLLSNKPNPYSNLTSTTNHNPNSTTNHTHHQRNLSGDNNLYTSYGLSSDRTAASGYISEVSEFSFDRVTVNTERTGMSSNVSWNFLEGRQLSGLSESDRDGGGGGVLGALGSSNTDTTTNGGGGGGGKLTSLSDNIDNLLLEDDNALLQQPNGSRNHHHPHHPHDRHSNNNGHRMNVFTGEIHQSSDQSVISEISEGIDGHDDDDGANRNGGMDFINSILMEKYEGSGNVVQHKQQQYDHGKGVVAATTPLRKQSSNNNNTISTVGTSGGDFTSIGSTHEKNIPQHPQQRGRNNNSSTNGKKKKTGNRSIFKSIMEDIQFCGMYFCGLDTTVEDDGQLTDNKRDLLPTPSKEARAKEMDSTFLGKVVNCAANNFK